LSSGFKQFGGHDIDKIPPDDYNLDMKKGNISEIFMADTGTKLPLPEYLVKISAGFPSPADDYVDKKLDLNEYLIEHPAATFFVRVIGDSMQNAGMQSGDILIVDRALEAKSGDIVLAVIDGEFTVKRFVKLNDKLFLVPENPAYKEIEIKGNMQFEVWGVVTNVIHKVN
jgi:DNA polymerase V